MVWNSTVVRDSAVVLGRWERAPNMTSAKVGRRRCSRVGKYLPARLMEKGLGVVFALVGGLVLALELL